ncbi:SIMPL domain-containing protein [Chachezhania sediminis]|uniref:SIMPL domain-containing protein n=1 Tax=Chachezhania sediminis TaxID=2599291 RepID=UPI00131D1AC7|nr:SIMPL domain-containing protein [Chachezhania sediminis]
MKQIAILLVTAIFVQTGVVRQALAEETRTPSITIQAQGVVDAEPDMATIVLGVSTRASEAQAAFEATTESASKILDALSGLGIADKDVQTRAITLTPIQKGDYDGDTPPEIVAYEASNQVTVRVLNLDELGKVLDSVAGAGANTLQGLQFGLAEPGPLRDQARAAAVKDAIRQAGMYAEAAGLKLGRILSIETRGGYGAPMMMEAASFSSAKRSVAKGEVSVTDEIGVEFELVAQ